MTPTARGCGDSIPNDPSDWEVNELTPRVLLLTPSLRNGGAERQLTLLAGELSRSADVHVLTLEDGPYRRSLQDKGIAVTLVPRRFRWDVRPAVSVWRLVRDWRPDVIHSWGVQTSLAAVVPARVFGVPLVEGRIRIGYVAESGRRRAALARALADVVVANSEAGLRSHRVPSRKGVVVYNGVALERLRMAGQLPRPQVDHPLKVIMVGRADPQKDFDSFIAAARRLSASEPNEWVFTGVCNGQNRARLLAVSADLVAQGTLAWPDPTLEPLPYVAASHVGVLMSNPPHEEGCSNVLLEYMACGLPVICTRGGGNAEVVEDGRSGYIIAPGDVDALVACLQRLGAQADTRVDFGRRGRELVLARFSTAQMVTATVKAYRSASLSTHSHGDLGRM